MTGMHINAVTRVCYLIEPVRQIQQLFDDVCYQRLGNWHVTVSAHIQNQVLFRAQVTETVYSARAKQANCKNDNINCSSSVHAGLPAV